MAYIIGLLKPEEETELERRGWDLEDPPAELVPKDPTPGQRLRMVFVDTDMFEVMSGPDWDRSMQDENYSVIVRHRGPRLR